MGYLVAVFSHQLHPHNYLQGGIKVVLSYCTHLTIDLLHSSMFYVLLSIWQLWWSLIQVVVQISNLCFWILSRQIFLQIIEWCGNENWRNCGVKLKNVCNFLLFKISVNLTILMTTYWSGCSNSKPMFLIVSRQIILQIIKCW